MLIILVETKKPVFCTHSEFLVLTHIRHSLSLYPSEDLILVIGVVEAVIRGVGHGEVAGRGRQETGVVHLLTVPKAIVMGQ